MESWLGDSLVEERRAHLRKALARLACEAFPRFATAALEIEAAGFRSPGIPQIFSRHLREIPPALNDDLLELYGRSEQALANRFSFFNRLAELDAEFDWEAGPSAAWCGELHAFDYALDLAMTCRISREERYSRHLRYLIAHWIARNPPGQGTGWGARPLARRVRNWILAADLARDGWEGDPEFMTLVTGSLAFQAAFLAHSFTAADFREHPLSGARALLLAGRFFGDDESLRARGRAQALETLENSLAEDGGYADPRPAWQLHLAEMAVECLLADVGEQTPQSERLRAAARRILSFLEGMLLPDGTLPGFGPAAGAFPERLADLFALAAVAFHEPRWKSLARKFGVLPYLWLGEEGKTRFEQLEALPWTAVSSARPASGIFRLGGAERSALIVNGHAPRSPDDHQDYTSYELFLEGYRLVVDCGDAGEPEPGFSSRPQAHNLVLADGHAPTPGGAPRSPQNGGPFLRQGSPDEMHRDRPPLERARWKFDGDVSSVWLPEGEYSSLKVIHRRAWFCLEGRAWIILDWLRGGGAFRIANLLHFYPTFQVELKRDGAVARSRSWAATVTPLGGRPTRLAAARGEATPWAGWYAPEAGVKYAASVLALETDSARLPWLGGYLISAGADAPSVSAEADPAQGTVRVRLAGKSYRLAMNPEAPTAA